VARTAPPDVAKAAKRGLELRQQFKRGGTDVGARRAHQLAEGKPISDDDVIAIASYFKRHRVDKRAKTRSWGDESDPSAGYIAWLLWGGDAGESWADNERRALVRAK
jgi:hypothetical protein